MIRLLTATLVGAALAAPAGMWWGWRQGADLAHRATANAALETCGCDSWRLEDRWERERKSLLGRWWERGK